MVCSSNVVVSKMFNMNVEFCLQEALSKSAPKNKKKRTKNKTKQTKTKTTNKSNQYNMHVIPAKTQPLEYGVGFLHFICSL